MLWGIFKRCELPRREHPLDRSPLVDRANRPTRPSTRRFSLATMIAKVDYAALETSWEVEISGAYRALSLMLGAEALIEMNAEQSRAERQRPSTMLISYVTSSFRAID